MGVGLRPTTKAVETPPNPKARAPRIYPDIRLSGSMSGEWKRGTARLVRHRQTKEPETDRLYLNNRVTPRLYRRELTL